MENINLNIPIFRAEEINSDRQVIGYLKDKDTIMEIIGICIRPVSIKPTTLAIHFPDMLDSQKNKIFASLTASGKGGDILNSGYGEVIIAVYEEGMIKFRYEEALPYNHTTIDEIEDEDFLAFYEVWQIRDKLESEVIGIQK